MLISDIIGFKANKIEEMLSVCNEREFVVCKRLRTTRDVQLLYVLQRVSGFSL